MTKFKNNKATNKDRKDSTVLITGANGGMGALTVKQLMLEGHGHIIMAARTKAKADQTAVNLIKQTNFKGKVTTVGGFDMLNLESINKGIASLGSLKIDVLSEYCTMK